MEETVLSQRKGVRAILTGDDDTPGPWGKLEVNAILVFHAHNPLGHQLDKHRP